MDILGHPIVPGNIIDIYFEHFQTLPWNKFVPTLDILLSLLKCVRNNRKNVSFVIFVMTQVKNYFLAFYNVFACELVWSKDTTTCCFFNQLLHFIKFSHSRVEWFRNWCFIDIRIHDLDRLLDITYRIDNYHHLLLIESAQNVTANFMWLDLLIAKEASWPQNTICSRLYPLVLLRV